MTVLRSDIGDGSEQMRLLTALGVSLAFHLAILATLSFDWAKPNSSQPEQRIRVSLAPSEPAQPLSQPVNTPAPTPPDPSLKIPLREQIVSPPESAKEKPIIATRLRSDIDSRTDREQVRRGDGAERQSSNVRDDQSSPGRQAAQAAKLPTGAPQTEQRGGVATPQHPVAVPAGAGSLRLNPSALQRAISSAETSSQERRSQSPASEPQSSEQSRQLHLSEYRPFQGQAAGSQRAALGGGLPGIPDYLPNVRDGEITLLNTKADRNAVFVRRVATQVFGALRASQWREVPYGEVTRLTRMSTVKATLNRDGKLLRVDLLEPSGSKAFDQALKGAVERGAWDQNPPDGALAESGNIEFIFKSRTWARRSPDALGEQRWLLLATGLL